MIYPGVPCSFNLARPFTLINATAENMLVVGGDRENELSVALSIFNSYGRKKYPIEIWASERAAIYKRYKSSVLSNYECIADLDEICSRIDALRKDVQSRKYTNKLIMVLGYETIVNDMELMGAGEEFYDEPETPVLDAPEDMSQIMEKIKMCEDIEEKSEYYRIIMLELPNMKLKRHQQNL